MKDKSFPSQVVSALRRDDLYGHEDETTVLDPDMSFADTLPAPDETAVLRLGLSRADLADELDQERMARSDAEEQVRLLRVERDELRRLHAGCKDVEDVAQVLLTEYQKEYDDLSVRSLPSLAAYLTEPFDEPIPDDARIYDRPEDGEPILKGAWPPVFGDLGVHYDRDIAAGVAELAAEIRRAALVADSGTDPAEVDGA